MAFRAKDSIERVSAQRPRGRLIRIMAVIFSLAAVITLVLGVLSFTAANRLMRLPPKDLQMIGSNIMPDYSLASFPSLNEQRILSGWFFPARGEPVSTIILVHDQGANRLQFGLDSPLLFDVLTEKGFNVLAFDLRHSGRSEGEMSGYGYAEWADVIAAIRYIHRISTTTDVILYGFGSGTAASLLALEQLPDVDPEDQESGSAANEANSDLPALEFGRSYIAGLILDTPASSPDDYIRPSCFEQDIWGAPVLQYTVPSAIRLSAGGIGHLNLITALSKAQIPVFIAYSETDTRIGPDNIRPLVIERQRLHPDTTVVLATEKPGYISGFTSDQESYLAALDLYLTRFFTASP